MHISDWSSVCCSSDLVEPASASVYYCVRHPEPGVVRDVFARLQAAAEGAAQGTGTSVVFEQSGGVFSVLPNDTLGKVLDASLRATAGVDYDADDTHFVTALQQTLESPPPLAKTAGIDNYSPTGPHCHPPNIGDLRWAGPDAGHGHQCGFRAERRRVQRAAERHAGEGARRQPARNWRCRLRR